MSSEKFHNTSITIKGLLGLIEAKDIAIPEIQRPLGTLQIHSIRAILLDI